MMTALAAARRIMMQRSDNTKRSLVIGASGIVGSHIVRRLLLEAQRPIGLSRSVRQDTSAEWIQGHLAEPQSISRPDVEVIYCTASARLLADALPTIFTPSLHRVVLFTTSSISTKASSPDPEERAGIAAYARAERDVTTCCDGLGVTRTVLRPTIIYDEGKDNNLTRIARLIARLGFFPLCGRGLGLRQPVHAEDCAIAAVNAAQSIRAENKIYELPGGETITYREMIGRIFDGMQRRRLIVPVPPPLWLGLFHLVQRHYPGIKAEMGARTATDLTFDRSFAVADLDWHPRAFRPTFDGLAGPRIFAWPYRPGAK
jgi:nucleoside-diphosphate-sugar epimerase